MLPSPPPSTHRPEVVARFREAFERAGYEPAAILRALGTSELPGRHRREGMALALWRTADGTPLQVLARLFLLGVPVTREAAGAAVPPGDLGEWVAGGLLVPCGDGLRATVQIYPCQGLLVAADWPDADWHDAGGANTGGAEAGDPAGIAPAIVTAGASGAGPGGMHLGSTIGPRPGAGTGDSPGGGPVMAVGPSSLALAQFTLRRPAAAALDLGTGSGFQALLAASHCRAVRAVDLNPRAVAMTRFNALLNGRPNVRASGGDWFGPVAGEAFDLIVCNPPFVISPTDGGGTLHTHGGRPADALCEHIVRTAPAFLRAGGFCQLVCNWAHVAGQDWRDRLAGWVAGGDCDAWVLVSHTEDAAAYAAQRIKESAGGASRAGRHEGAGRGGGAGAGGDGTGGNAPGEGGEEGALFDRWMAYYQRERIEAVSFGVITLRRSGGSAPWFACDKLPPAIGPCGAAIEGAFARRDFLASHRDDRLLLQARLRLAPAVVWDQRGERAGPAWSPVRSQLRLKEGLAYSVDVEPAVAQWLARCTGARRLGEALAGRFPTTPAGQEARREFLPFVRGLVERGFLLPVVG